MKKITHNTYTAFLPFLLLYILVVVLKHKNVFVGDEGRYWAYAENLINGFYASLTYKEYSFLWNGPGYPIFLIPFNYFNTPLIIPKICNAVLLYLSLVYFYKSLLLFLSQKKAYLVTFLLGLYYPNVLFSLHRLLTEALSFFLVCMLIYLISKYEKNRIKKYLWWSSFVLGYLILTKVIFSYVCLAVIIVFILGLFTFPKNQIKVRQYILMLFFGLLFTSPYLLYTYSITGKLFYYGNSGGKSLYWMSTPYEEELGDWHFFETINEKKEIANNHKTYIDAISTLDPVEKDQELKRKAVENILKNKKKFFKNWQSNIGRLFFDFPYSYRKQSNRLMYYILPNSYILVLLSISLILAFYNYKKIALMYWFCISFAMIYIGGISFLSSYPRFLYPIIPFLIIWICYIFKISLEVLVKPKN